MRNLQLSDIVKSKEEHSMSKASSSIIINKPVEEVFSYTASPVNGPAFIPNLSENTNVFPEEGAVGQSFNWRFNMAGVDLRGQAKVTEFEKNKKVTIETTGDSETTWIYSFEAENGATKVSVDIDYEVSEGVVQKMVDKMLVEKLNQRTAEQMLENLRTILEG